MNVEQRKFRSDPLKLKRLRVAGNYTAKELKEVSCLDRTTVAKILRGEPVFLSSIAELAKVFEVHNPLEVLHPDELVAMGIQTEYSTSRDVLEWTIEEYMSGWQQTSNGLQFQITRLKHKFLEGRMSRGKCYELRHLACAERERAESNLMRHVEVCNQIGFDDHITRNFTAAKVDDLWWVLDQWEDGETLDRRLEEGALSDYELQVIMTGIAKGLDSLHRNNIIRRELTPKSILLRDSDDRPILTDMELAKLLTVKPTVSPKEWPDDPYRALEVEGDDPVDFRADIYSWGRIFVHASNGQLSERGCEELNRKLPKKIEDIVMRSVTISRSDRPKDIKQILKSLKGWV